MDELTLTTRIMAFSGSAAAAFGITGVVCAANHQDTAASVALGVAFGAAIICAFSVGVVFGHKETNLYGDMISSEDDDDEDVSG